MVAVVAVEEGASVVEAEAEEDTVAAVVSEDEAVGATIRTNLLFWVFFLFHKVRYILYWNECDRMKWFV